MISRRTARCLGELYQQTFRSRHSKGYDSSLRRTTYYYTINGNELYDFLFDNDYSAYFCNEAEKRGGSKETRKLKDFIMRLHTGESLAGGTSNWSWEERKRLGQRYLKDLCKDILKYWTELPDKQAYKDKDTEEAIDALRKSLELDGYEFKNSQLLASEADVLDVGEETGILQSLYSALALNNQDTAFHHLKLSEEHYLAEKWDDSISNSRKFFECVLQEVAAKHSLQKHNIALPESTCTRPFRVRDYLEHESLLETKEKEAIASVYGLLSHAGGHPYMAQNDQARLLRHLALTFSQFVMLRLKGSAGQS